MVFCVSCGSNCRLKRGRWVGGRHICEWLSIRSYDISPNLVLWWFGDNAWLEDVGKVFPLPPSPGMTLLDLLKARIMGFRFCAQCIIVPSSMYVCSHCSSSFRSWKRSQMVLVQEPFIHLNFFAFVQRQSTDWRLRAGSDEDDGDLGKLELGEWRLPFPCHRWRTDPRRVLARN